MNQIRLLNQQNTYQFIRMAAIAAVMYVVFVSQIFQPLFVNSKFLIPFSVLLTVFFLEHVLIVFHSDKIFKKENLLFLTFAVDAFLITGIVYLSGLSQSLFIFLYLINIVIAGFVLDKMDALKIAIMTSIFFNMTTTINAELKSTSLFLTLFINNISFFAVAGLTSFLKNQFNLVGEELQSQIVDFKELKNKSDFIIENMPLGYLSTTNLGEIVQANKFAVNLLGVDDLNGKNLYDILGLEKTGTQSLVNQDIIYSPPSEGSERLRKILNLQVADLNTIGTQAKVVIFYDVTEIRRLENQVKHSEKLAAIGQLAAGIAHEIRNPLASISGSVEMLSQSAHNEDDRKLMKIILKEISRLNMLITEFLDFAKPIQPPTEKITLDSILNEVISIVKNNSQVRREIIFQTEIQANAVMIGDKDKLKQALLNIILNACQAMNEVADPVLSIFLSDYNDFYVLRIKDNGSGMSPQTKKRLFEAFYTTKPKGTGLGLAITHKILENHQTKILVESELGKGTEFVLEFKKLKETA